MRISSLNCLPYLSLLFVRFMASGDQHSFYKLNHLKLGCEVQGIQLDGNLSTEIIQQIKKDVTKHRLLVFRNQGVISGATHVNISQWFGELESTFFKHPRSPHPDVFRVSNDEAEGCTKVGRTGWHIDGSFHPAPYSHAFYHIIHTPQKGDTVFAPLTDIWENLSDEKRSRWERLWHVSDSRRKNVHPLVYAHPVTGKKGVYISWKDSVFYHLLVGVRRGNIKEHAQVMCFHLGFIHAYVWDYGKDAERWTGAQETEAIVKEIHHEFTKNNGQIQYRHKWIPGDFIISDNLAIGHEAHPDTQLPVSEVGLRVMHRTTVKGTVSPAKSYPWLKEGLRDEL